MRILKSRTIWLVITLWIAPSLHAQLLSPQQFLGYALGDDFTPHHRVTAYFEHVAAEVPNITLERYGTTTEGRLLQYAVVSSAENMDRLESIRINNLQRARLRSGTPDNMGPAIVWLSYNVHGNESVSTEAAIATLHSLADSSIAKTQAWLEDVVVILDPCINPDGRERYVQFYRSMRGHNPDPRPEAREHAEPWPGGRTNHYYFDLNRDWAWGTQTETRQRLVHYNRWMPHIHVDFHEQGVDEPYYFAPAAEPYHTYITTWQRELQELIGQNHARYFDAQGWLFFTRQIFDLFYPGYGDTWPMFNGAIGMTYEQGGSGRAGLGIVTAEGDTLTLRDRIDHHFTTSLSTIEVAVQNRSRILSEFADYFDRASTMPTGSHAAYVVSSDNQSDEIATLKSQLDLLGIRHAPAARETRTSGFSYRTGETGPVTVGRGDLVIPATQPKGVLTSVLFEPEAELVDSLSYDITAWALPYVYGLEAYAVDSSIDTLQTTSVESEVAPDEVLRPAAYLAEWTSFEDAQFLANLLQRGVRVRFSEVPFVVAGKTFDAGTLIMTRSRADQEFDGIVRAAARAAGQPVYAIESTLVTEGVDFGSSDVPYLRPPRVAVVAGPAVSAYSLGEIWHFFDEQLQYPATLVNSDAFARLHLYRYDVVILPSGGYGSTLTESRLREIREWIRAGGRLIAIEGAARFLAGKDGFGLKQFEDTEDEKDEEENPEERLKRYADRDRAAISEDVTGAIFRATLDVTHPLAFGYGETYFTLKRTNEAHTWLDDGWNVGIVRKDARVSGFAGSQAEVTQENSLLFGTESIGLGEVVYLLDSPIFRGFWYGGRLLLANAVFLVGQRSVASF